MPTFSELLRNYIERTGISDSELARSVGVRRQTIFRWKEGLVARPRHRDDVLRVAGRLRLSDDERDGLLLAAGFPPENADFVPVEPVGSENAIGEQSVSEQSVSEPVAGEKIDDQAVSNKQYTTESLNEPRGTSRSRWPRLAWIGLAALLVLLGVAVVPALRSNSSAGEDPSATHAAEGETLLLVAQFVGYADDSFNVAGRIGEALTSQIEAAGLAETRATAWSGTLTSESAAKAVLQETGATLLIWGEYDSGRVRVNFTLEEENNPTWERLLTAQDDLPTVINIDVPQQVQALALITLGRLYREQESYERAAAAFERALVLDIDDKETSAAVYALLGSVYERLTPADTNQAVEAYSQAIGLNPMLTLARYNRGTIFLNRYLTRTYDTADLDRAIADFRRTISMNSDYAPAYLNRGTAYYERKEPGDLEAAIDDLSRAIELDDSLFRAYYNRALARIRLDRAGWREDLTQVLALNPDFASAYNALCWGNMLDQQPEQALPYCDEAVDRDPTGASRDSRGMVYAQLGRTDEAITELEAYLAWLETLSPPLYSAYNGPLVEEWIASLRTGENPFDSETLAALRQ